MRKGLLAAAGLLGFAGAPVMAAGDLSRQEPVTVTVQLGTAAGEHRFVPALLKFETGRLYRLRLENPSPNDYYFSSAGLADAVYTRKVAMLDASGKTVTEVYGSIRRLEVKSGGRAKMVVRASSQWTLRRPDFDSEPHPSRYDRYGRNRIALLLIPAWP